MPSSRIRTILGTAAVLGLTGCQLPKTNGALTAAAGPTTPNGLQQLLPTATLAQYKSALPAVLAPRLKDIMNDADTLWYDDSVMIPSYQDSVAPEITVGPRKNSQGAGLIVPEGRGLFTDSGDRWSFPFGHTAGTDTSTNLKIVDFVHLPVVGGKRMPVAYWIVNSSREGAPLVQWRWLYPKGTMFGEVLFVTDGSGGLFPVEVRTRERFLAGWATNVYRPFPTAASLVAGIQRLHPEWQSDDALKRLVAAVGDNTSIKPDSLKPANPDPNLQTQLSKIFAVDGANDTLPAMDAALVKDLLTKTPFVSAYQTAWKTNGALKAFAASTQSSFSVVPANYKAALVETSDDSCHRCHTAAQKPIADFADAAVLYGDIWGSDQIFSFHIFDQDRYNGASAADTRAVRPVFLSTGVVAPYDSAQHPDTLYRQLK